MKVGPPEKSSDCSVLNSVLHVIVKQQELLR